MAEGLGFADPWLLLVPAAALIALLARSLRSRRVDPALPFVGAPHTQSVLAGLGGGWRSRTQWVPACLQASGVVLATLALARPVDRTRLPARTLGIDIMLCIDVSSSMAEPLAARSDLAGNSNGNSNGNSAADEGSRLSAVVGAAQAFVQARDADRIGLVRFAEFADLGCPLTSDHDALGHALRSTQPLTPSHPEDRTGIGYACARAAQVLADAERATVGHSKVLIVFTDGLENVATSGAANTISPREAAEACRELGVRVHVISTAVSSKERTGRAPLLALAERTGGSLAQIATAADGAIATPDIIRASLGQAFADIDQLEPSPIEEPRMESRDMFAPWILLAILATALGRMLALTVWSRLP